MRFTAELDKTRTQNTELAANVLCNTLFLYCTCSVVGTSNITTHPTLFPFQYYSKGEENGKERTECETEEPKKAS